MADFSEYRELIMKDMEINRKEHDEIFNKLNNVITKLERLNTEVDHLIASLSEFDRKVDTVCKESADTKTEMRVWDWLLRLTVGGLLVERIITMLKGVR